MSCFLIGENTHLHELGEQLNHRMQENEQGGKESYTPRLKQPH